MLLTSSKLSPLCNNGRPCYDCGILTAFAAYMLYDTSFGEEWDEASLDCLPRETAISIKKSPFLLYQ